MNDLAECLGMNPATIFRELVRGRTSKGSTRGWGYRADLGEGHKVLCGRAKGAKPKIVGKMERLVKKLICLDRSPEHISARPAMSNVTVSASLTTTAP